MKFNQETIATIGVSTGIVKLASGTITTPVAYLDLVLAGDYLSYSLTLSSLLLDTFDILVGALSFDGGVSFLNDTVNLDTYQTIGVNVTINPSQASPTEATDGLILYNVVNQDVVTTLGLMMEVQIYPGSDLQLTQFMFQASCIQNGTPFFHSARSYVNPAATVAPIPKRATHLRLFPYGNGDANPPTSGETITSGSYVLLGNCSLNGTT